MLVALVALDWQQQFQHPQVSDNSLADLFTFQVAAVAVVPKVLAALAAWAAAVLAA
jgi:hypothetical protein